jgi:ACS family hexuronate transporter-like MFS transporter
METILKPEAGTAVLNGPDLPADAYKPVGRVRWGICGLIFAVTTINYIDRQVVSVLKPTLDATFHWTQTDYGHIVLAFSTAYAIGQFCVGFFLDRVGVRRGLALAVVLWSLAAIGAGLIGYLPMNTAMARGSTALAVAGVSVLAFGTMRFLLGLAEAANFPAAIKTVAQWFPQKERSVATGFVNAGSNVGALATPLIVPILTLRFGWPTAFFVTGALGFLWLLAWLRYYRDPAEHEGLSTGELAYIRSDQAPAVAPILWTALLGKRQTWAFSIAKFCSDPVWWFYLFWAPDFFHHRFGLDLKSFGWPLAVIYLMADFGSVIGGWFSCYLMGRGWTVNAARKTAMLVCALCVLPVIGSVYTDNVWVAVGLIGLAASAHQGWSSNLFTLISDTTPGPAVGSVCGIGGTAGAVGVMLMAPFIGYILDKTHNSYAIPVTAAPFLYLIGLLAIHLLLPRLEPMRLPGVPADATPGDPCP